MSKRVLIYQGFERFWHWTQAVLVLFLAFTGFGIVRNGYAAQDFETLLYWHETAAWAFLVLVAFAIFWHFTTGEWRQYLVAAGGIPAQLRYYLVDIFKNRPHPVKKTALRKLNPLQAATYLGLKILVIPVIMTTGLLLISARHWNEYGLEWVSYPFVSGLHRVAAYVMMAFMFLHIYLTTTGHTPLSNLKAMITGYEDLEEEEKPGGATPEPAA
jgi:thiosulfate reductase cytochrome b subunit